MKRLLTKRVGVMAVFLLSIVMLLPLTASAAYYNTYSNVATLGNASCCSITQGFAVGSTYTYSVKVNSTHSKAVTYRTKMSDGSTTLMTNGDNGSHETTDLGHANDVVLSTINGEYYMFVVTMKEGEMSLVKLKYVSTTFYKVGNYTIHLNGANKAMSGVKITSKDSNYIYFLFKSGEKLFRGTLPLTDNSGTIDVFQAFTLNKSAARVNGSLVPDISSYDYQGFGYYNDTLYVPMTNGNVSIVLVYRSISHAAGEIYSDEYLSFRITSAQFPYLFEVEGVGIGSGGKLWFNTNRKTDEDDIAHDGVHYFNDYSVS